MHVRINSVATSYNVHVNEVPWSSCYIVLFGIRRWENIIIFKYHKYTEYIYYLEGRDTKVILYNKCSMKIAVLAVTCVDKHLILAVQNN
jgi:hypothetical protein